MDTGGLYSVTSYLPSPLLLCLLAVVGFYPFICKASVTCVDCSGPGCEHPGICETEGKCFLRRDVNGLLYRGCADNKRWNGLDLSYNGCRWQHYLGWAGARVLWCLCRESKCNNVTVGIFILRKYSPSPEETGKNLQSPTEIQTYNSQYSKLHPKDRENITSYHRNLTESGAFQRHEDRQKEYQLNRGSNESKTDLHQHNGEKVANRHNNISDDAYKQVNDLSQSSSLQSAVTNQQNPRGEYPGNPPRKPPERSGEYLPPGGSVRDLAVSPPGGTTQKPSHDHLSDVSNVQEDSDYHMGGGINPTLNDKNSVRDDYTGMDSDTNRDRGYQSLSIQNPENQRFPLEKPVFGKENNQTISPERPNRGIIREGTGLNDNSQRPNGQSKGDLGDTTDLEDQDIPGDNKEGTNGGLDSPQSGGAKNNDDYRWLVLTDGSVPYEPIGPLGPDFGNQDLNRGGLDPNREGPDLNREGPGPNREGPDPNREGIDLNRGDLDPNREGPDPNRGGPDPNRGGLDPNRGGLDPNREDPDPNREGLDPNRGGPDPNREGLDPNRAGPDPNREGLDPNRADPDPNRGGSDPNRAGPDPNRGGSDRNRGDLDPNRGGIEPLGPGDVPGGEEDFWDEGVREGPSGGTNQVSTPSPTPSSSVKEEEVKGTTTDLPLEIRAKCPPTFRAVPHLYSCYHVDQSPRTWRGAAQHCADLDPRSHLVTLDKPGEYEYIVLKVALEPILMSGWQGWWTSGRYSVVIREFTWSTSGHVISRLDPRWRRGLVLAPYFGTCVWLVPLAGFKLGNYGCTQPAGAICEINL